jgi:serine protease AprX
VKPLALSGLLNVLLLSSGAGADLHDSAKLHGDFTAANRSAEKVNVIVRFVEPPNLRLHALVRRHGGELRRELAIIDSAAYRIPAGKLRQLAARPEIAGISLDQQVKATMDTTAATVGATTAWNTYGLTGKGIGVAVIDSGVGYHADLFTNGKAQVVYNAFYRSDTTTDDLAGHGTHVAGIIAGNGTNSTGSGYTRTFKGIAPGANIINIAVLDRYSQGTDSNVIAGIQQAIALKSAYNIRVINLSLGRSVQQSYATDPLCQAVEAAWKAGIVVVVAAGNEGRNNSAGTKGYGTIGAPGNDPFVITVGATKTRGTPGRSDDAIASYSSKGPTLLDHVVKPDLVAPGNQIVSLEAGGGRMRNAYPSNNVLLQYFEKNVSATNQGSDQYYWLSGTSMSTPVVSGAVALILQKDPTLTPDQVKARLMKTAWKGLPAVSSATDASTGITYTSYSDLFTVGAGYLDIAAALANTDKAAGSARSPKVDVSGSTVTLDFSNSQGLSVIWGTNLIWGTSVIWGTSLVSGNAVVGGSSVIWGTSGTSGFSIIWGTSVIWGTGNPIAAESDLLALGGEK